MATPRSIEKADILAIAKRAGELHGLLVAIYFGHLPVQHLAEARAIASEVKDALDDTRR